MTTTLDEIEGIATLFADLQSQLDDADYSTTLEEFQEVIAQQHAGMFAGEYDSNLVDWKPLKASTVKRKGFDRILVETGDLKASLVHVGGPGNIHSTSARSLVFGSSNDTVLFHQVGTRNMPARPPVGLSEETLDKLTARIADATVEILLRE